ncbi:MAG: iron-containing alcohol dehydrogenase [Acidobacteria bacterium]|nr:iron-containing alcohol dehydrogenase [Acidobacteriota bacterium]
MTPFEFHARTRLVFGPGSLDRLGDLARELGFRRTLLVADHGLVEAGHVARAAGLLESSGIEVLPFHDFGPNPNTGMVKRGRAFAAPLKVDSIVGLGGGSSMDCAKGINFLLTNGGSMRDYWGYGKAAHPMLPMIGIPTTTGTGSEAQSYALITEARTHVKMACGDPKASFRVAILDPTLAASQPPAVRAAAGYDAISHAVETSVTTRRNPLSLCFSREAWRLLAANYERTMAAPQDLEAVGAMQLGAHCAGIAIEHSMLGATHACANPLTAHYGTTHGIAIAALLAHVVEWNGAALYRELAADLPARLLELAQAGGLSPRLSGLAIPADDLPRLAQDAAGQWTGRFNPRPFDEAGALEIYRCAY